MAARHYLETFQIIPIYSIQPISLTFDHSNMQEKQNRWPQFSGFPNLHFISSLRHTGQVGPSGLASGDGSLPAAMFNGSTYL